MVCTQGGQPITDKPKPQYSEAVDAHIYGVKGGCVTEQDWRDLADAALDQATHIRALRDRRDGVTAGNLPRHAANRDSERNALDNQGG